MSSNSTHEFPSPIGGVPFPEDLVPSILFSTLHALLIPIFVWRLVRSRTRTLVLLGVCCFTIERTVFHALRAYASHHSNSRESKGLETYFQTTLAGGYVTLGQDLMNVSRALFVNATKGSEILAREAKSNKNHKPDCGMDWSHLATLDLEDHPRARTFIRRVMFLVTMLFWAAIIIGIVASVDYPKVLKSGAYGTTVRGLWNTSAALAISLLMGLAHGAVWACYAIPRVPRQSTIWIVLIAALVTVVPVYRLYVLRFSTTSLASDAPGSLNSAQSKATFYVFHSAPEFLSAAILVSLDARQVFNTGLWGDRRRQDPESKV
ncbi:hypothetical protein L226DRAFT_573586 [Lentinus tigrinus ALCF2SS1-7]|uniref:Uncharacterized protein n=1 Tax=Lentinus tigrinus ALCF2SS1-6 TaxID=1328759 RepID=A0A5C2S8Q5_9APHY|nr:hypothetical protein L227DRAFT_221686 [Lentinus tigrinus ALCF2SS1-6]RPD71918.1 hypothetical protein L226DRAFT_573586 [Lentinus tigrinus ALCF2SS1-7]